MSLQKSLFEKSKAEHSLLCSQLHLLSPEVMEVSASVEEGFRTDIIPGNENDIG